MAKKTIWISRDIQGYDNQVYFWNNKPVWRTQGYECPCPGDTCSNLCEVTSIDADCGDLNRILRAFGVGEGELHRGQLVELTVTASVTERETLATKAKKLLTQMKSRSKQPSKKEVMNVLQELSKTGNEE